MPIRPTDRPFRLLAASLLWLLVVALGACSKPDPARMLQDAQSLRERREFPAAAIELKNLLQLQPDNAEARNLLGQVYNDSGDAKGAEQEFRRALELKADPGSSLSGLARALLRQGKYEAVLDDMQVEAARLGVNPPELAALRGLAQLELGRPNEARALFGVALSRDPGQSDALLGLARLAASEKRLEEAAKLIDQASSGGRASVEALLLKADIQRALGNEDQAVQAYQEVLKAFPGTMQARLSIASIHVGKNRADEALRELGEILRKSPDDPLANHLLALLEYRRKNYEAAKGAIGKVLKHNPNHGPTMLLAGAIDLASGADVEGQRKLRWVIDKWSGHLQARKMLASSLLKTGNTQEALDHLQIVLQVRPNDVEALRLTGEAYIKLGDHAGAARQLEKALAARPSDSAARAALGLSRLAAGEIDRAAAELEQAAGTQPAREVELLLVTAHIQRGEYDRALQTLARLDKAMPDDPVIINLRGAVLAARKETASARREFARALAIKPGFAPAAINLAKLDLREGKPDEARRRLEALVAADPNSIQGLLTLASLAPELGATRDEALGWLQKAAAASKGSLESRLMIARFHLEANEPRKALEAAAAAQKVSPDHPQVLEVLGAAQAGVSDHNAAVATYSKLAGMHPRAPAVLYRLGLAQSGAGSHTAAALTLNQALAINPRFAEARLALGEVQLRGGKPRDALATARELQKTAPSFAAARVLEGDALQASGNTAEAARAYEAAFRSQPSGGLVIRLNLVYAATGRTAEGRKLAEDWLAKHPADTNVRAFVADAALASGDARRAMEEYQRILVARPEDASALNNLAWAAHLLKDPRAQAFAERAYQLDPNNAAVLDTLGWILVEDRGDTIRGIELLQRAITISPDDPNARYHLAQAWLKAGDRRKARHELELLARNTAPFDKREEARTLLRQLQQ